MTEPTWVIFHADPEYDDPQWLDRKLPSGALTQILKEEWNYANVRSYPEPGHRFTEYARLQEDKFPSGSTHHRPGDWVVTRVEVYPAPCKSYSKREIVICYCRFDPIPEASKPEWKELQRV